MTSLLNSFSAVLLSMETWGLSTKTLSPSRFLGSGRGALPWRALFGRSASSRFALREQVLDGLLQRSLRRVERGRLSIESKSGAVMLQPFPVQPAERREPLDPSLAPSPQLHLVGGALDEVAPLADPAAVQDHLAVGPVRHLHVGDAAVADQERRAFDRTERLRRRARGRCGNGRHPCRPRSTTTCAANRRSRLAPGCASRSHLRGGRGSPWRAVQTMAGSGARCSPSYPARSAVPGPPSMPRPDAGACGRRNARRGCAPRR